MFENIGGKIKKLAMVLCWLGIIASVIYGICNLSTNRAPEIYIGIIVAVVGPLLSWISSFILYGFGQLIENTDKLVLSNPKIKESKPEKTTVRQDEQIKKITELPSEFVSEIKKTSTEDLKLIYEEQRDLYSEEEFKYIENELKLRY